jgi:hypothetical protein
MRRALSKILRLVDDQEHAMDLDRDGLGEDVMDVASEIIEADFDAARDPDGNEWPDLEEGYFAWKADHALTTATGYLEGEMAESANFKGERSISPHRATMTFGVNPIAKQEGPWFHNGDDSRNRPARPFWGFSAESIARQMDVFRKRIEVK